MMERPEQTLIDQTVAFQGGFNAELVFDGVRPNSYTPYPQDFSS